MLASRCTDLAGGERQMNQNHPSNRSLSYLTAIAIGFVAAAALTRARTAPRSAISSSVIDNPLTPNADKRSRTGRLSVILVPLVTIVAVLVSLMLPSISSEIPSIVTWSLPLVTAGGLALAGFLVWKPESDLPGSKSELGAALLGGAVIAFAVLGLQLLVDREQTRSQLRFEQRLIEWQNGISQYQEQQRQRRLQEQELRLAVSVNRDLTGADLQTGNFSHAYLKGKILVETNLRRADLSYSNLGDANLTNADLRGASLFNANLRGARLQGAIADLTTTWPRGFRPAAAGVKVRQSRTPPEITVTTAG
jgi:hypothetical protein